MTLRDIAKTLKGAFYEEDAPAGTTPPKPSATAAPSAPVISNASAAVVRTTAETAEIDQKLQGALEGALEAAGITIYKALDSMLESLADVVPDQTIRYKKALEILAKQGHTLPLILQDVDKAIGALEDSSREFESLQKSQFQKSVGALHQSVETLTAQITAKQTEAARLSEEISAMTKKRNDDAASISTAQAEIDHVASRHAFVYRVFMQEIQNQRSIIEQQLKAGQ